MIQAFASYPRANKVLYGEALVAISEFLSRARTTNAAGEPAPYRAKLAAARDLVQNLTPSNVIIARVGAKCVGVAMFSIVSHVKAVELQMMVALYPSGGPVGVAMMQKAWDIATKVNPQRPRLGGQLISRHSAGLRQYYINAGAKFVSQDNFEFQRRPNWAPVGR